MEIFASKAQRAQQPIQPWQKSSTREGVGSRIRIRIKKFLSGGLELFETEWSLGQPTPSF